MIKENVPEKSMNRGEFLLEMEEILELPLGTLQGGERLDELQNWDSTALIELLVLVESAKGAYITPEQLVGCTTVADLLKLAFEEESASRSAESGKML